jgi:transcriptional regulator with XRE-family HTH domain
MMELAPITFLSPADFSGLGLRIYGHGWQRRMAEHLHLSRAQIIRYANGQAAVPATVALLLALLAKDLDHGTPARELAPAGHLTGDGFRAA